MSIWTEADSIATCRRPYCARRFRVDDTNREQVKALHDASEHITDADCGDDLTATYRR